MPALCLKSNCFCLQKSLLWLVHSGVVPFFPQKIPRRGMINYNENILSMRENQETFKISFSSCCSLSQVTSCPRWAAALILQLLPVLRFSLKEMYFLVCKAYPFYQDVAQVKITELIEPGLWSFHIHPKRILKLHAFVGLMQDLMGNLKKGFSDKVYLENML